MKNSLIYIVFLMVFSLQAQQPTTISLNNEFMVTPNVTFLNAAEDLYQVNILTSTKSSFSCVLNFRMEDALVSNEDYRILKDVTFFDFNLNQQIGAFFVCMTFENLLGFKDTGFAIEPMIDQGVVDEIYFSHEANFLISTSVSYTF